MGIAIANSAASLGAEVVLVLGPSTETEFHPQVIVERVVSAKQMYEAAHVHYPDVDVAILAAAVADYRPTSVADQKIKKATSALHIELEPTQDILASLGTLKKQQFLVGFALETENEKDNAIGKLKRKNLDAIVLNSLNDQGAGFGKSTNKITFIDKEQVSIDFPLKTKVEVAQDIINEIISRIHA